MPPGIRIFDFAVNPPARLLPPRRFHVPFYRLQSHRLPVRWHLYRNLLRACPDAIHCEATRSRWRLTERLSSTSPLVTATMLREEATILADYRQTKADPGILSAAALSRVAAVQLAEERRVRLTQADETSINEYVCFGGSLGVMNH